MPLNSRAILKSILYNIFFCFVSGGWLNNYNLVNTGLSGSLLGSTSKYDSERFEQYMKNLRNFLKIRICFSS